MSFEFYGCANCGFWQEYFAAPPACPVCSDVRNALPENGWRFASRAEMKQRERQNEIECSWLEIDRGIWMFSNSPQIGIGSSGYLILGAEGNIAFEAAGWYTEAALNQIRELGGIRFLSASHPHGFGALWQLEKTFEPEFTVFQREAVQFTKALNVNFVFDDELEINADSKLFHVGGHYEGQSVLFYEPAKMLFCGDALKFETENGKTTAVSCHKAFHKQIPLSKQEIEKYRTVLSRLDFRQVCTPFEHCPDASAADAMRLFDQELAAARTFTTPILLNKKL